MENLGNSLKGEINTCVDICIRKLKKLRLRIYKSDFLITGVCHVFRCQKTITINGMKAKRITISEHQFIKTVK